MDKSKKMGHTVESCVVVSHLSRLSATLNQNGTNGTKPQDEPRVNNSFFHRIIITIHYSLYFQKVSSVLVHRANPR